MMRLDTEAPSSSLAGASEDLLQRALTILPEVAVLVLSDYAKGVLRRKVCEVLIAEAQKRNIPVVVDPKSRSFRRYRGATLICPNRKSWRSRSACRRQICNGCWQQDRHCFRPCK